MFLNLGAGMDIRPGWVNYDLIPMSPDVNQIDLEKDTFAHADNTVDMIAANDFLEHIHNLKHVLNECHRVLKPSGVFMIEVPNFPHIDSVKDPTHVRFFVPETFKYLSDYEEATQMYGFKPWILKELRDTTNRIYVKMSPKK